MSTDNVPDELEKLSKLLENGELTKDDFVNELQKYTEAFVEKILTELAEEGKIPPNFPAEFNFNR